MTDKESLTVEEFDHLMRERFPNHVPVSYGGSAFNYVVGNLQTAVVDEILMLMESWTETLQIASEIPELRNKAESRDWEVSIACMREIMSEVRQYRTRGTHGMRSVHTGNIELPEEPE